MIPLLRVKQPSKNQLWQYFNRSIEANRLANAGPCYELAKSRLQAETGQYCWLLANATLALELAIRTKFPAGARILIPSFTFKATYLAVVNACCIPVVCEVNQEDWCLDPNDIKDVDGAIVVSPFGRPVKFHLYETLGVPIIYDMAGAWGQWYKGNHLAIYSMHATKLMPVGEGALVIGPELDTRRVWDMANFSHTNAKLSELSCAMLLALMDMNLEFGQSLNVMAFKPRDIYALLANDVFATKRYYYPLIEDMYDCEVRRPTSRYHVTRHTLALPRDVDQEEMQKIEHVFSKLAISPLCV